MIDVQNTKNIDRSFLERFCIFYGNDCHLSPFVDDAPNWYTIVLWCEGVLLFLESFEGFCCIVHQTETICGAD